MDLVTIFVGDEPVEIDGADGSGRHGDQIADEVPGGQLPRKFDGVTVDGELGEQRLRRGGPRDRSRPWPLVGCPKGGDLIDEAAGGDDVPADVLELFGIAADHHDAGAETGQLLLDVLVATVDVVHTADLGLALGGEREPEQGGGLGGQVLQAGVEAPVSVMQSDGLTLRASSAQRPTGTAPAALSRLQSGATASSATCST